MDKDVGLFSRLVSRWSEANMWVLLMLLTGSLGSPALWADEVDSKELVGTRWAEKDAEGDQPNQEGWRALRGELEEDEEKESEDVANQFQRHQLPAMDVLESRTAKDPNESKEEELVVDDDHDTKHGKETRKERIEKKTQVNIVGKEEEVGNLTRQLEVVAFPVGVAIGAIGAAIWPSVFPERTTTTTASAVVGEEDDGRDPTTTTTVRFSIPPYHHCDAGTTILILIFGPFSFCYNTSTRI